MLESSLSNFGYHVLGPVENPQATIYLATTEHIDAAIVDTNIDRQIAEAVADRLMERGIPFVYINIRARMFNLYYSAIPRQQKHFTIDDLQRTITRTQFIPLIATQHTKLRSNFCCVNAISGEEQNAEV